MTRPVPSPRSQRTSSPDWEETYRRNVQREIEEEDAAWEKRRRQKRKMRERAESEARRQQEQINRNISREQEESRHGEMLRRERKARLKKEQNDMYIFVGVFMAVVVLFGIFTLVFMRLRRQRARKPTTIVAVEVLDIKSPSQPATAAQQAFRYFNFPAIRPIDEVEPSPPSYEGAGPSTSYCNPPPPDDENPDYPPSDVPPPYFEKMEF